jgi:hypothetical protein
LEKLKQFFQTEPVLVRGLLVALAGILAQFGIPDVNQWVDLIVDLFTAVSALFLVLVARPTVTSMAKVIAFQPKPFDAPEVIYPGNAVVDLNEDAEVVALEQAAVQTYEGRHAA